MSKIVEVNNVYKAINGDEILSDINLAVEEGTIYGFLGPNGAGKTTLMKCMLTLSAITSGEIKIFGKDLHQNREEVLRNIGSIIEIPIFYENCTAEQVLEIHAKYMGIDAKDNIETVLKLVGLETNKKKVKEFSLGMRQRLGLARALLTKPKLLILDEPINGLDPVGVQEIRNILLYLSREKGMTIFISSHILSEISHIADTIGVIKKGRMIEQVSMKKLKRENIDLEAYFMSHFQEDTVKSVNY